ncbi:hypothetical protein L2095_26695 [Bacillus zanthoxyli]|nr:hypothetical protein [Bacillus zanthoxyli]
MSKRDYGSEVLIELQISKEIKELVEGGLKLNKEEAETVTKNLMNSITISVPSAKATAPELPIMEYIPLPNGGVNGGTSIKPGNIRLNLKGLMRAASDSVLAIGAAMSASWLVPFSVIQIINNVLPHFKITFGEREGVIIYTLFTSKHENNENINENTLFEKSNIQLQNYNKNSMNQNEFEESLLRLQNLGIINRSENGIELKERVILTWS